MKWLISDANIFIDMEEGGLIQTLFQLPETFVVPDILYTEELAVHHAELPGLGLQVLSLREETVVEAVRLRQAYHSPSQNDLFALALAKQETCPLLTGDKLLREAATQEQVEVRGTLWLMERFWEEALIDYALAKDAYALMRRGRRRLPWDLVRRQLKKFGRH